MNGTSISAANITVLREDNWTVWWSQLTKLLGSIDCKRAMESRYKDLPGDELTPEEKKHEQSIVKSEEEAGADGEAKKTSQEKRKSLQIELIEMTAAEEKLQDRGMFAVDQTLSNDDKKLVASCRTVRQQLAVLKKVKIRPQNIYALNESLTKIKWERGESATVFLLRLNDLKERIDTARGSKDDSMFVTKLLKEMPHYLSWTKLKLQEEIQTDDANLLDWRALCDRVQRAYQNASADYEERKEKRANGNSSSNCNGRSNGRQRDQVNAFYTSRRKACYNCGSEFHLARNCPEPRRTNFGGFRSRYNQVAGQGGQSQGANRAQANQNGAQSGATMQSSSGGTNSSNNQRGNQSQNQMNSRSSGADQREPNNIGELIAQSRGQGQRIDTTHQRVQYMLSAIKVSSYMIGQEMDTGLQEDQFMVDNGSNCHVINDRGAFLDYRKFGPDEDMRIESVNGGTAQGVGTVRVISKIKGVWKEFELGGVLLIETCPVQIFSQLAARARGMTFKLTSNQEHDYISGYAANGDQLINARARIDVPERFAATLYIRKIPGRYSSYLLDFKWHSILSHADYQRVYNTAKVVEGMKIDRTNIPREESCEPCIEAKDKKRTFDHQLIKSEIPGETLHVDIAEMSTNGLYGQSMCYVAFMVFVDEFSRHVWTYPLRDQTAKSIRAAVQECFSDLKAKTKRYPDFVHLDKGTGLMSETVQNTMREFGVKRTNSAAYNHQQNGLAEKTIGDLRASARAVRLAKRMPAKLWPEAVCYVTYTANRTWKRSIMMTPIEALTGKRPNLSHMRASFGDPVFVHVNNPQERKKQGGKEGAQAVRGTFMGYSECSVIYRVLNYQMTKITEETGVRFLKQVENPPAEPIRQRVLILPDQLMPNLIEEPGEPPVNKPNSSSEPNLDTDRDRKDDDEENDKQKKITVNLNDEDEESDEVKVNENEEQSVKQSKVLIKEQNKSSRIEDEEEGVQEEAIPQRTSVQVANEDIQQPAETGAEAEDLPEKSVYDFLIHENDLNIPKSLKEAEQSKLSEHWLRAMDREFEAFIYHDLFELVQRTAGMNVLRGHWVFDCKTDENGFVTQLKARWVVDGSSLTGLFSLYAPVVEFTSLRALFVWAVEQSYEIHIVDASNAFLNSAMRKEDEPVFMMQVIGYRDPLRPHYVCQLKKSLYGLPQSAANWNNHMSEGIKLVGFKQSRVDRCVFYEDRSKSFIAGHVDDLVVIGKELHEIQLIKDGIGEQFPIKDRGSITMFLGTEFVYRKDQRVMQMRQREKIEKCFDLIRSKPKATKIPIQPNINLYEKSEPYEDPYHYRSVVGLLSYIAQMTRPDLAFTASQFSRFMRDPTRYQYEQLCKAVCYLYETKEMCLTISFEPEVETPGGLHIFVDCGEPNLIESKCRRTTGIVETYKTNIIGWSSKRQTVITSDIVEGELYALNSGLRKGLGTRNLLDELELLEQPDEIRLHLYSDSKTASSIAKEGFKASKHFDQTLLYIKEFVDLKQLTLTKVAGKSNPADLLTKFVSTTQSKQLIKLIALKLPEAEQDSPKMSKNEDDRNDAENDTAFESDS